MDNESQEKTCSTYIDLKAFPVNIVLPSLLQDKTTKRNIIFATDVYRIAGDPIDPKTEITAEILQQMGDDPVQPRCFKSRAEQADRTRKNAEVFTPVWICNQMNNYCDEEWFGRKDVFNTENGRDHTVTEEKINFPKGKSWQKYVDSRRLEITCGEAPFLVSRYDAADGSPTSAFIDGHFIVGFEDGFTGNFYHIYGVGLHPGGKYATYAFDNFIIRRQ